MSTDLQPIADIFSPGSDLQAYMQTTNRISVLTADEEKTLAEDLFYQGNLDAARQLVLAHLRFVVHIAKSYSYHSYIYLPL